MTTKYVQKSITVPVTLTWDATEESDLKDIKETRMTQNKHTPGPWFYRPQRFDDWGYVRAETTEDGWSPFICQAKAPTTEEQENGCRRNGTDPWEANARLIAAAPDLLEALEEIRDMLWSRPDISDRLRPLMGFAEEATNQKASSAIAKARGQS